MLSPVKALLASKQAQIYPSGSSNSQASAKLTGSTISISNCKNTPRIPPEFRIVITPTKSNSHQLAKTSTKKNPTREHSPSVRTKRKAESCVELLKTPRLKFVCRSEHDGSAYTPLAPRTIQKKLKRNHDQCEQKGMTTFSQELPKILDVEPCKKDIDQQLQLVAEIEKSFDSLDLEDTEKRAFIMVKWSLMTNSIVRERYSVQTLLGWGGCGAVLSALRRSDNAKVAIKIIYKRNKSKTLDSSKISESEILSNIENRHIVSFYESFQDSLCHYLVMENFGTSWKKDNQVDQVHAIVPHLVIEPIPCLACSKLSSKRQIEKYIRKCPVDSPIFLVVGQASCSSLYDYIEYHNGRIPQYAVKIMFAQIADAVLYLHQNGIVHGDIKEENVLVGHLNEQRATKRTRMFTRARSQFLQKEIDGRLMAKLCDFGHAAKLKRNSKRLVRYGTRELTAPELYVNLWNRNDHTKKPIKFAGFAQDIWALGFLLFTMLKGNLPDDLHEYINGECSFGSNISYPITEDETFTEDCVDLLQRMLTINPDNRIDINGVCNHIWLKRE